MHESAAHHTDINDIEDAFNILSNSCTNTSHGHDLTDDSTCVIDWTNIVYIIDNAPNANQISITKIFTVRCHYWKWPDQYQALLNKSFDTLLEKRWNEYYDDALSYSIDKLKREDLHNKIFDSIIRAFPLLRNDDKFIYNVICIILSKEDAQCFYMEQLKKLQGNIQHIRILIAANKNYSDRSYINSIADIILEWTGTSAWGQLMYLLFMGDKDCTNHSIYDRALKIVNILRQLPLYCSDIRCEVKLESMSGASRATWRQYLCDEVGDDRDLRLAVTEAMLWFVKDSEDQFVQWAAVQLNADDLPETVRELMNHPSEKVKLRAQSAQRLWSGTPDPIDTFLCRPGKLFPNTASGELSKTWLNDPYLERILVNAFSSAAESLAEEVRDTASSGEEALVARLFERIKGACSDITTQAKAYARENDKSEWLDVTLNYRIIGKSEEGASGLADETKFSTDISLIIKASSTKNNNQIERGILIQAKRMKRHNKTPKYEFYTINVDQIRDIDKQTTSSFLLAVGPKVCGVAIPVMPARLFLDRFDDGVNVKELRIDTIAANGRNMAEWLVYDVIGLWTGDSREDVVKKAREGRGDRAVTLVEIAVALKSTKDTA